MVAYDEVKEQNYNLSVSTYVEQEDTREKIDIVKLNAEIKKIVAHEQITVTFPVINGGVNPSRYIEKYNQLEDTITISQGGASAGYVNWIATKFWADAHCYVVNPSDDVIKRYGVSFFEVKRKKFARMSILRVDSRFE